jgi:hypothetical protein
MQQLSTDELQQREDPFGVVSRNVDGVPYLLAFLWMD